MSGDSEAISWRHDIEILTTALMWTCGMCRRGLPLFSTEWHVAGPGSVAKCEAIGISLVMRDRVLVTRERYADEVAHPLASIVAL